MKRKILATISGTAMLAACAGPIAVGGAFGWSNAWSAIAGIDEATIEDNGRTCESPFGTWFVDFGVRGLACSVQQVYSLSDLAEGFSGGPVWTAGPHTVQPAMVGLALDVHRDFGRYNAGFVRWAAAQAVPNTPADAARTQASYDRHVRRLARVYWVALTDLESRGFPSSLQPGPAKTYLLYLRGGPIPADAEGYEGGISMYGLFGDVARSSMSEITAQESNIYEALYEAVTAYGFWLRRSEDGTLEAFSDGLESLLGAYDPVWLAAHS